MNISGFVYPLKIVSEHMNRLFNIWALKGSLRKHRGHRNQELLYKEDLMETRLIN
jgi:hypothetical protein